MKFLGLRRDLFWYVKAPAFHRNMTRIITKAGKGTLKNADRSAVKISASQYFNLQATAAKNIGFPT